MELRKLSWPSLRPLLWTNFGWEGNVGVQKNWVPIETHRTHVLFSHSLEPHTVLKCDVSHLATQFSQPGGKAARIEHWVKRRIEVAGGGVRYEWAERPDSPESTCTLAHRTSAPYLWHQAGFHLYQGVSRATSIRAIPRGGTPCLALFDLRVCLGHFRTRLRKEHSRSTYFHFFYAIEPKPPYTVVNVSRPFRFARADTHTTHSLLGPTGVPAKEEAAFDGEAVQFAAGMVLLQPASVRVTYGIGDCVSATRDIALSDVADLLGGQLLLDQL